MPVLNSAGAVAPVDGGTGLELLATALDEASKYVGYDASGIFGLHALPSGGGGGGSGVPNDGSVTWAKLSPGLIATEADIFDDPAANDHLVANKTLADAFAERDEQLGAFWTAWSSLSTTTLTTIAGSGALEVSGLAEDITQVNSSSYNVLTSPVNAGTLYLAGTSCAGLPTLSSGTLRGALLYIDSEGTRWCYPIDNPESPDGEEFYRASGGAWQAVGYKGDALRVHLHALMADSKFNSFAAHHVGGPGSAINAFNGETAVGQRAGDVLSLVRAVYSTSTNQYSILVATQRFEIPLTPGSVETIDIADGAITAAKLGQDSVTGSALASGAVADGNIFNRTISGGKLALRAVGLDELDVAISSGDGGKVIGLNSGANAIELYERSSGGSTPGTGSITTISQFSSAMLANEEAVLDAGANNTSLVGNATLKGIVEDISSDHLYGAWSAASVTTQFTLPAAGGLWTIPNLGGDGQMAVANSSSFNAMTANIGSGRPNFFGPACSGLPTLSSGTIRGAVVVLDEDGARWAIPVSNPEGPDSEAAFKLVSGAWSARSYRADDLRLDFARIRSNDARYEVFSSLALHGPTANELRDEVLLARADGRSQYALRVGYNTSLVQYEIVTAKRDAVFNLRDDEVQASNIDTTNAGTDGQMLVKAGEQFTYQDVPSGGGASLPTTGKADGKVLAATGTGASAHAWESLGLTSTELYTYSGSDQGVGTGTYNFNSGASLANHQMVVVEACVSTLSNICYYSPMLPITILNIGSSGTEMSVARHDADQEVNVRFRSNTQFQVTHSDSLVVKKIHGISLTLS